METLEAFEETIRRMSAAAEALLHIVAESGPEWATAAIALGMSRGSRVHAMHSAGQDGACIECHQPSPCRSQWALDPVEIFGRTLTIDRAAYERTMDDPR